MCNIPLGAEVVLVDQLPNSKPGEVSGADLAEVDRVATQLTIERDAFRADQFRRKGNPGAHEQMTGPEIWCQSEGKIDAFCDFVPTMLMISLILTYVVLLLVIVFKRLYSALVALWLHTQLGGTSKTTAVVVTRMVTTSVVITTI